MGNIEEGLYFLSNKAANFEYRADFKSLEWNGANISTKPAANTDSQMRNQRVLITQVPSPFNDDDQYYYITNLFLGVQARFNKEKSAWVCAEPSTTNDWNAHWGFHDCGNNEYYIYWRPDHNYIWDMYDSHCGAEILAYPNKDGNNQRWRLERDRSIELDQTASWMSHVPSKTKLTMMNIICTHQSLALQPSMGSRNPICHDRSVYEQLVDGVRTIDPRLAVNTESHYRTPRTLVAKHGVAWQGYSFPALLQSLKLFLQKYPSETVRMGLSIAGDVSNEETEQIFRDDFHGYESIFYIKNPSKPHISDIALEDVRGKVILSLDKSWTASLLELHLPSVLNGPDSNAYEASIQGECPREDWDYWWTKLEENIARAKKDSDSTHRYSTNIFASKFWFPGYDPDEFQDWAAQKITSMFSEDQIKKDGARRIGWIWLDFYAKHPEVIRNIIRSNPGCGDVFQ